MRTNEAYDQNTTLVYGFKYTFTNPIEPDFDTRVFVGTYVDTEYGSYFDEDDGKTRFYEDMIILVDGEETRIPPYFTGVRVWD